MRDSVLKTFIIFAALWTGFTLGYFVAQGEFAQAVLNAAALLSGWIVGWYLGEIVALVRWVFRK